MSGSDILIYSLFCNIFWVVELGGGLFGLSKMVLEDISILLHLI